MPAQRTNGEERAEQGIAGGLLVLVPRNGIFASGPIVFGDRGMMVLTVHGPAAGQRSGDMHHQHARRQGGLERQMRTDGTNHRSGFKSTGAQAGGGGEGSGQGVHAKHGAGVHRASAQVRKAVGGSGAGVVQWRCSVPDRSVGPVRGASAGRGALPSGAKLEKLAWGGSEGAAEGESIGYLACCQVVRGCLGD
jgi:hypothetical protein